MCGDNDEALSSPRFSSLPHSCWNDIFLILCKSHSQRSRRMHFANFSSLSSRPRLVVAVCISCCRCRSWNPKWTQRGGKVCKSCRSKKRLIHYMFPLFWAFDKLALIAKNSFDTAENEPSKVWATNNEGGGLGSGKGPFSMTPRFSLIWGKSATESQAVGRVSVLRHDVCSLYCWRRTDTVWWCCLAMG